jgi:hypothetical protein
MDHRDSQGVESERLGRVTLFSYVPLLAGEPGRAMSANSPELAAVLADVEACPTGQAEACLWFANDAGVHPVFVIPQAEAIGDHLAAWADGRASEWFELCFAERGGRYAAFLVPDVAVSVERFRTAYMAARGRVPDPDEYDLVFRPLSFVSGPDHNFGHIRDHVANPARLGLLDPSAFDPADPSSVDENRIRWLGPFAVCRDGRPFGLPADALLQDLFATSDE